MSNDDDGALAKLMADLRLDEEQKQVLTQFGQQQQQKQAKKDKQAMQEAVQKAEQEMK